MWAMGTTPKRATAFTALAPIETTSPCDIPDLTKPEDRARCEILI